MGGTYAEILGKTHIKRRRPVPSLDLRLGFHDPQQHAASIAIDGPNLLVVQCIAIVQADNVTRQNHRVIDGGHAETAARLGYLGAILLTPLGFDPRLQWL